MQIESIPGRQLCERLRQWFEDLQKHSEGFPTEANILVLTIRNHLSSIGAMTLTESEELQTGEFPKT